MFLKVFSCDVNMASWNWVSQCTRITPNFLYCWFKAYFRFRFNSVSVRAVLRTNGPRQLNCILGSCYWFLLFKVVNRWLKRTTSSVGPWWWSRTTRRWWRTWLKRSTSLCFLRCYWRTVFRFFSFAFGRAQMDFESTLIVHDPTLSRCIRVHFLCFWFGWACIWGSSN